MAVDELVMIMQWSGQLACVNRFPHASVCEYTDPQSLTHSGVYIRRAVQLCADDLTLLANVGMSKIMMEKVRDNRF